MQAHEIFQTIRTVIHEEVHKAGCEIRQIWLFDSRARHQARPDSDWDLFVVIDRQLSVPQRQAILSRIRWRLAEKGIDVDILIQSEPVVVQEQANPGTLVYSVAKEAGAV